MKKTVIALFAALALLLGSGALVSGASAAPYPNTVPTKSTIKGASSVNEGKSFTITVRVRAGNASVKDGNARITFNGRTYTVKVRNGMAKVKLKAPQVKRTTKKTIKVRYRSAGSSVYKESDASKKITIKNKKQKKRR